MNYLFHLYLAGDNPELQLGGLMGDFVKGPISSDYPGMLAQGLLLHRRIDSLAQNSIHTRQSRQRLNSKFGHGRGIIVDIFYDHFLALNWEDYSSESLSSYTTKLYTLLQENLNRLPNGLQQIVPFMIKHDWLCSYRHQEIVAKALLRISQRLSRPLPLAEAIDDLVAHQGALLKDFKGFMTEASDFVKNEFDITLNRLTQELSDDKGRSENPGI